MAFFRATSSCGAGLPLPNSTISGFSDLSVTPPPGNHHEAERSNLSGVQG